MQKRLGKGMDSLLPPSLPGSNNRVLDESARILDLSIDKIRTNPEQPRKDFDEAALEELAASIRENGVIQPIIVQGSALEGYIIIAGERRYRASIKAGKSSIPAILKDYSKEEAQEVALIENIQRRDLNPMEEALAFQNILDTFELTQDVLAKKLGKSRSAVANTLRLLKLHPEVQVYLRDGKLSAGHARALLSLDATLSEQLDFAKFLISKELSVREAEALVKFKQKEQGFEEAYLQLINPNKLSNENSEVRAGNPGLVHESNVEGLPRDQLNNLQHIRDLSKGAKLKDVSPDGEASPNPRAPELWDMEEKLIIALGTKVQLKGDVTNGKIEINYYSMDDLERLFELLTKGRV